MESAGVGLDHGAEIAVAGSGPAACAFATALLSSAQIRGLRLEVRLYDSGESATAQPPAVVGPLARHRLAALGVSLLPESCAAEVKGVLVWNAGRSELLPLDGGSAWVVDGWPAQSPGAVLLQRQLAQAAALRGARFVARPLDEAMPSGGMLALRAGGSPERAQVLAVSRALHAPALGLGRITTIDCVRARLFASARASSALGGFIRVFAAPAWGVDLIVAIPAASSVHLTAYGARVGASELALAMAELRRQGALPDGLEIAELTRQRIATGLSRAPKHPRVVAIGDACAANPLDPLGSALEQGQRAALAVAEASADLGELPTRAAGLLAGSRDDVAHALRAVNRFVRAGPGGPRALGKAHAMRAGAGGLFFGLGPLAHDACDRLLLPALIGPMRRLWSDEGPGRLAEDASARPIYVVDDDPAQRALLCEYLTNRKLPVRALPDELGLLAAAMEEPPRAVVLDVVLNWVDGLRLCRSLRNHPATRNTPVFVMSGLSRSSDRNAALAAGATAFFPKPLDLDALATRLEQLRGKA